MDASEGDQFASLSDQNGKSKSIEVAANLANAASAAPPTSLLLLSLLRLL